MYIASKKWRVFYLLLPSLTREVVPSYPFSLEYYHQMRNGRQTVDASFISFNYNSLQTIQSIPSSVCLYVGPFARVNTYKELVRAGISKYISKHAHLEQSITYSSLAGRKRPIRTKWLTRSLRLSCVSPMPWKPDFS